jgi:hypothetical protein
MFIFHGQPLSPDVAFTDPETGVQYPANWLRLATPEERAAIGITEQPDPAPYDQRFYWGPGLPKDHAQLVEQWSDITRTSANSLLQPTDWIIIREADNGKPADPAIKTWRENIRLATGTKITAIRDTADTDALAAYITGADYPTWPSLEPVRARNADGTFAADDPATPDVDEAWMTTA